MRIEEFLNIIDGVFGKEIRVTCSDGQYEYGKLSNYTSELDNEPDGESITIDLTRKYGWIGAPMEIEIAEIKSIEII